MTHQEKEKFIKELNKQFFDSCFAQGLVNIQIHEPDAVKIKEKAGSDALHFEVCFKRGPKPQIEIAFHNHLTARNQETAKSKINNIMLKVKKQLRSSRVRFRYEPDWKKYWSRLYTFYQVSGMNDLGPALERLLALVECLKPELDKIKWANIAKKTGRGK